MSSKKIMMMNNKVPKSTKFHTPQSPHLGLAKSITFCTDSRELNTVHPDKITRFYKVPGGRFATEEQVINYYGFKLGEKFAEGGFATIFKAVHIKSGIPVACKKVDLLKSKGPPQTDKSKIEDLKNELFILRKLNNPYIVRLYAHFVINTNLYIFLKYANAGTLAKYCKSKGVLSERESKGFFGQLLVAFDYLHSLHIAHRDIKLENILLLRHPNKKLTVLLADFGLSRLVSFDKNGNVVMNKTYCGTIDYMAPEILLEKPYNALLVDIWALGVTLFTMLNGKCPFDSKTINSQIKLQLRKEWKLTDNMLDDPPDSLIHFLSIMLEPNPFERATMKQLIKHPWIHDEYLNAKTYFDNYYLIKQTRTQSPNKASSIKMVVSIKSKKAFKIKISKDRTTATTTTPPPVMKVVADGNNAAAAAAETTVAPPVAKEKTMKYKEKSVKYKKIAMNKQKPIKIKMVKRLKKTKDKNHTHITPMYKSLLDKTNNININQKNKTTPTTTPTTPTTAINNKKRIE